MRDRLAWFSPKKTGFGLRPSHPMGWLITALFVAVLIISLNLLLSGFSLLLATVLLIFDIVIYSVIVFATKS